MATCHSRKPNAPFSNPDPSPYSGPIERADGVRPWNRYLWPTEEWVARDAPGLACSPSYFHRFSIVALLDGRYSTEGCVYDIEKNRTCSGRPCVFATRTAALRTAAARAIRLARASSHWRDCQFDRLQGADLATVINWYRGIVARESGRPPPAPVAAPAEPEPPTQPPPAADAFAGLPLFEFGQAVTGKGA